VIPCVSS